VTGVQACALPIWTNFAPPSTAPTSLNGKYLRYYATSSNGITYYSNTVIIVVTQHGGSIADITAPNWRDDDAVSLTAPSVSLSAGQTITGQGWQTSDNGNNGWTNFAPPSTASMSLNGKYLRYYATSSSGTTYYSNTVVIGVHPATQAEREVTIAMFTMDTNWQGWNYSALRINVNGTDINSYLTMDSVDPKYYTFDVYPGDVVQLYWRGWTGSTDRFCAFAVYYSDDPPNPAFDKQTGTTDTGRLLASVLLFELPAQVATDTLMGSFTVTAP
jgi:hypothetical protein